MGHSLKTLVLLLVVVGSSIAVWACNPGSEAARRENMKSEAPVRRDVVIPPIDREQPARFETATFALG
ncbi:MAG: hypothetical protein A4E61_00213 [Syntrophorhabdus sp. PtaB.Bin184]|jgi:hypothetical protein|nr:MAG: hypothetical protein A4E61_00213 [Syntrophorhabdus sp. PtaB.Bin184]